jgi:hypothetical protein
MRFSPRLSRYRQMNARVMLNLLDICVAIAQVVSSGANVA